MMWRIAAFRVKTLLFDIPHKSLRISVFAHTLWGIANQSVFTSHVLRNPGIPRKNTLDRDSFQITANQCFYTLWGKANQSVFTWHDVRNSGIPRKNTLNGYSLQIAATHCNTLQHTATHCNTLHHTVTHCNTRKDTLARYFNTNHYEPVRWHILYRIPAFRLKTSLDRYFLQITANQCLYTCCEE